MARKMKSAIAAVFFSLVGLAILVPAMAEDMAAATGPDRTGSPFAFDIGLRLFGADIGVGYKGFPIMPDADTTIWAYLGGGYQTEHFYRTSTGVLVAPSALAVGGSLAGQDPTFSRAEGAWRLGIDQGAVWNPRTGTNLVSAFLFYRGRYDANLLQTGQLIEASTLPDKAGLLLNSIQVGFTYDNLLFDTRHKIRSGISGEISTEWGPGFLLNTLIGNSSFMRMNLTTRGFLPLFDVAPGGASNLFSGYLGDFFAADYAFGFSQPVPLYIRQTFGGRDQIVGLGGAVRGVDSGSFDTNLKAVNNLELRVNLPALFTPNLVPGLIVFLDAGFYSQIGEAGVAAPYPSNFIASAGAGLYIDLFDLASLAAYVEYRLDAANADGTQLTPFAIEFGMHF